MPPQLGPLDQQLRQPGSMCADGNDLPKLTWHGVTCLPPPRRGLVKPDIVFFGEMLPARFHRQRAADLPQADLLIVLGTSLVVQPFASLIGEWAWLQAVDRRLDWAWVSRVVVVVCPQGALPQPTVRPNKQTNQKKTAMTCTPQPMCPAVPPTCHCYMLCRRCVGAHTPSPDQP